jgi:hypothetical protein
LVLKAPVSAAFDRETGEDVHAVTAEMVLP